MCGIVDAGALNLELSSSHHHYVAQQHPDSATKVACLLLGNSLGHNCSAHCLGQFFASFFSWFDQTGDGVFYWVKSIPSRNMET